MQALLHCTCSTEPSCGSPFTAKAFGNGVINGALQDVKVACAAVGMNLDAISLDEVMSATQDRHQSAAGQAPTTPAILASKPPATKLQTTEMSLTNHRDMQ